MIPGSGRSPGEGHGNPPRYSCLRIPMDGGAWQLQSIGSQVKVKSFSRVRIFATPWTVAYQAPPSIGFSRQEYWSGLLSPSPGDLPDPISEIKLGSPTSQADALTSEQPGNHKMKVKSLSCVRLFATPWMVAYKAPQSMGFSRQEYWSGLPFPSPGDLPNPGIEPGCPAF